MLFQLFMHRGFFVDMKECKMVEFKIFKNINLKVHYYRLKRSVDKTNIKQFKPCVYKTY